MRKTLSDKGVQALKPRPKRYAFPDPELRGHYVRVQPGGAKSYAAVTMSPHGKQIWTTLGDVNLLSIDEAREKARDAIKRVKAGLPALVPVATKPESFEAVAEHWLERHVRAKGLRTQYEIVRALKSYVYPRWKDREFLSLRRGDVVTLLDEIEDDNGARQADAVLTIVRAIMNWYAIRNDDYTAPIVRGMRRQSAKAQARARILSDDEIRAVWQAADAGAFGAFVRLLLLTAQRRRKVAGMRWQDIALDGTWKMPLEAREKGNAGEIRLPDAAMAIIRALPKIGDNPHVFAGRGKGPINGFSKAKGEFDAKLTVPHWQLHDLRRTARSLMARAGVRPEIAERVLGHVLTGVEGVYDRHQYSDEKADALARLASMIDGIVSPKENVIPLEKRKA